MRVICLGDSFTRGFGVGKHSCWVSKMHVDRLDFINKGINGDTTSGMLARLQNDVIDSHPRYTLISGGINDFITGSSVEIPKNNYMALIHQSYHNLVQPLIGIEPVFSPENVRSDWAAFADFHEVLKKHMQLREWLLDFSKTFGVPCIDFFGESERMKAYGSETEFYIDGIHLTERGHEYMAAFASHTIKDLLNF